jgi:hypothetical protein
MIAPFVALSEHPEFAADYKWTEEVFACLAHLEETYPGFRAWYYDKIGDLRPSEERAIFIRWVNGRRPLGIAIAKRSLTERKLCTLWVDHAARASGVAAELGSEAFAWLGTTKPLFTVPEERIAEFKGLLNRWDFRAEQVLNGYYRLGKAEYVFNGRLQATVRA